MKRSFAAALAAASALVGALTLASIPNAAHAVATSAPGLRGPALAGHLRLAAMAGMEAAEFTLGALRIKGLWMRATPKGATVAGGYLSITNTGTEPDRLVDVASDVAGSVEVHEMNMSGGVMTMRPVPAPLEVKPGATLELKPGGYHVMFTKLKQGLSEGDKVKATLVFEKAGKVEIEFPVGGLTATGAGQMPDHKM
ncbi:hypothetical protein SAMN05444161_4768 [Rhizobiales bacterium GAS191]|jgi:copper(I)-binding protein|nr:hypothetical protein SAMN05444161_4768 [Rhizobiales bacterium GAS191]SEE46986.1 hypothetical protein SAMN05519104_6214 [Rhizobiales bacterium GAS188]